MFIYQSKVNLDVKILLGKMEFSWSLGSTVKDFNTLKSVCLFSICF